MKVTGNEGGVWRNESCTTTDTRRATERAGAGAGANGAGCFFTSVYVGCILCGCRSHREVLAEQQNLVIVGLLLPARDIKCELGEMATFAVFHSVEKLV